jgi:RNA polymerase sigma factor (sigma-70 family)
MTGTRPADILRHLDPPGADDRTLVSRYAFHSDEAAFAELVRRHGPVVWAACLRVVGNRHDAEDAFQAVFLVFMRRLAAIRNLDLLGNWLYGVAVRVSLKARRSAARRRTRERQVPIMPDPPSPAVEPEPDLGPVIDEELAAVPAWYRDAVVLCDLRGVSREEAAKLLGIPEGTLSSRLAAGRKKLAARLARRGVTLSVAAIPGVLGAGARAAVPAELVAKVVHISTGSAAPVAVARLASEGISVKTTLLMSTLFAAAAAAAGVVYAAGPTDSPQQPDPPKPPAVAKADPAQKPDEKVTFTTRPRMQSARDYQLGKVRQVFWSPDGKLVAMQGSQRAVAGQQKTVQVTLANPPEKAEPELFDAQFAIEGSSDLVGFAPGGKALVTEQRERDLVSGLHRLRFMAVDLGPKTLTVDHLEPRVVDLDTDDTDGYHFAAVGKTFRTVSPPLGPGGTRRVTVTSVGAATGKTLAALATAEGEFRAWKLSARGELLAVVTPKAEVSVYDAASGKVLWTKVAKPLVSSHRGRDDYAIFSLEFSPDARRLVAGGQMVQPVVFDAATGAELPKLEGAEMVDAYPAPACFTGDGRLLVLSGAGYTVKEAAPPGPGGFGPPPQKSITRSGQFLCVWDADTGKLLKRWSQRPTAVAFHPSKPVLAILEANGENTTRLGLWDFAAGTEKK